MRADCFSRKKAHKAHKKIDQQRSQNESGLFLATKRHTRHTKEI